MRERKRAGNIKLIRIVHCCRVAIDSLSAEIMLEITRSVKSEKVWNGIFCVFANFQLKKMLHASFQLHCQQHTFRYEYERLRMMKTFSSLNPFFPIRSNFVVLPRPSTESDKDIQHENFCVNIFFSHRW